MAAARSRSSAAPCRGCARKSGPTRRSLPPRLRSWRRCAPPTPARTTSSSRHARLRCGDMRVSRGATRAPHACRRAHAARASPLALTRWLRSVALAQENVQAESAMMVPDCRMWLESALADLQAAVVRLVCSGGASRGGCARARTHTGFDLRHRTPGGARRGGGRGRQRGADHSADTHRGGRPDVRLIRAQHTRRPARDAPVAAPACPRLACNCQRCCNSNTLSWHYRRPMQNALYGCVCA